MVRIKDTSPERLQLWFEHLKKVLAQFNIKPGFQLAKKKLGESFSMLIFVNNFKQSLAIRNG
jgi:hypothetical protein